jgi:hypothetical protein
VVRFGGSSVVEQLAVTLIAALGSNTEVKNKVNCRNPSLILLKDLKGNLHPSLDSSSIPG